MTRDSRMGVPADAKPSHLAIACMAKEQAMPVNASESRRRLLEGLPVAERTFTLAGIKTPVLHGGSGTPVILLHGPGANAAHWLRVIPDLVKHHQVIAPDLPGHGESDASNVELDVERALSWLGELIERCCTSPPKVVGQVLGGAMAARFAARHGERISRLVLCDTLGFTHFEPEPAFADAMQAFFAGPSPETHLTLWGQCALDAAEVRRQFGTLWEHFEGYNVDRASTPAVLSSVLTLVKHFGVPIPPEELKKIRVPTALIWGRGDRATNLKFAEEASARYDWPLFIIDDAADDPPIEQPRAFVRALRRAFGERP
jgi:pimeloyl-ACP methyl ester carboxylesterase